MLTKINGSHWKSSILLARQECVWVCVFAHMWLRMQCLSNRCTMTAPKEGWWSGPVSQTCLTSPPVLGIPFLISLFSDLSIRNFASCWATGSLFVFSSEIHKKSKEAHCWSTALQQSHNDALWEAHSHSFASKLFFLLGARTFVKQGMVSVFLPSDSVELFQHWFSPKDPSRFAISSTNLKQLFLPPYWR